MKDIGRWPGSLFLRNTRRNRYWKRANGTEYQESSSREGWMARASPVGDPLFTMERMDVL